jgi:hypothetical protein
MLYRISSNQVYCRICNNIEFRLKTDEDYIFVIDIALICYERFN